MPDLFTRSTLTCPACRYDVTQTLRDGFAVCPECGEGISADRCLRTEDAMPAESRRLIYASWLAPLVAALFAVASGSGFVMLVLLGLAAGVVYYGFWWAEDWLEGPGAWKRAIKHAAAIIVLDGWILIALFAVVTLLTND